MQFSLLGIGCWGPGFNNWLELSNILKGVPFEHEATKSPKPDVIPATERRRAPLPVKLAIESSWQACQTANLEPSVLPCIFTSTYGDTDINDYMCRTLNTETKPVSPTKFHNSVHNAAAGYWTISTKCMQAANSTAADEYSFPLALLEGAIQAQTHQQSTLLTSYDAPVCDVLKPLFLNDKAFSASIIIAPKTSLADNLTPIAEMELSFVDQASDWPNLNNNALDTLYSECPTAKILALLQSVCQNTPSSFTMPMSNDTSIKLDITI